MLVRDFLATYNLERDLAPRSLEFYRYCCDKLREWNGGDEATVCAACERLNEFIAYITGRFSRHSARTIRRGVLIMLKAAERDLLCELPKRIRPVSPVDLDPQGFSPDELVALMTHANAKQKAAISLAYDTGLRHCDLERVRWPNLDEVALLLRIVQQKTRRIHVAPVSRETIELCRAIRRVDDHRLIPLSHHRREFYRQWRKLGVRAGLDVRGRSLQAIRRTSATLVAVSHGEGEAAKYLGHSPQTGLSVFLAFYRVRGLSREKPKSPPRPF